MVQRRFGWIRDDVFCFFVVDVPTSLDRASQICAWLGADLVEIRDEKENDFVYNITETNPRTKFWIRNADECNGYGLYDLFEPKPFSNGRACLALNERGRWETTPCSVNLRFVCQTKACIEGGYRCHDDAGCMSKKWVCDGERDCKKSGSDEQNCPSKCSFEETGISGEIEVTNSNQYKDNANCMWTIIGPVGKQIKLSVEDFNTEEHRDYVHIYDPANNIDVATLSGQPDNQNFYMVANQARITFTTDSSVNKTGFKIKWTSDVPELNSGVTELTPNSSWQTLTSPFYPNSPRYFYREWLIRAGKGEVITYEVEKLIGSQGNSKAYLTTFDGEEYDNTLTLSISSLNIPTLTITNTLRVIMFYYADSPPGQSGFKINFKKGCNLELARTHGIIQSPNMVEAEYQPSKTCTWLITNPDNTTRPYTLNITKFNLQDNLDNVKIFDDERKTTSYHPEGGFKGSVPVQELTVGNQFYLMFTSSAAISKGSFQISYSLGELEIVKKRTVGDPCKDVNCNGGTCKQGVCECPEGYTGTLCENLIDPCSALNCSSSTTCWNPDYPTIQPTCVCQDHKVRSDSDCKEPSYDFDVFVNPGLIGYLSNLPESEYIYINMTKGLTIILWAACIDVYKFDTIFYLRDVDGNKILSVTPNYIKGDVNYRMLGDGRYFSLNNKKWNHIVITVTSTGRVEVTVNDLKLDGHSTTRHLEYVKIGHEFVGYISRLRLWNRVLTESEVSSTGDDPDSIPDIGLIFDWNDMPSSRYQTRIFPSRLQSTSKPIYLCENGVYHEECATNIDKTPPVLGNFEYPKYTFGIPHYGRSLDVNGFFYNEYNYLRPQGMYEGKLPLGAHDWEIVLKDQDDDHSVTNTRVYVISKLRGCQTSPVRDTMTGGTCPLRQSNTALLNLCQDLNSRPSIPTPKVYTCGELGSYNGLVWRTPTTVPPCGETAMSPGTNVKLDLIYNMGSSDVCSAERDSMREKVEQKIKELGVNWTGLCDDEYCGNVEVKTNCTDSKYIEVVIVAVLPSVLSGYVDLSPLEFFNFFIHDSDDFPFPTMEQSNLTKDWDRITIEVKEEECKFGSTYINNLCVTCGPGSLYNETTKKCDVCDYGFYQNYSNQTNCKPCSESNQTTLALASTREDQCIEKCSTGSYYDSSSKSCEECPRDFYQSGEGKDICIPCHLSKRTRGTGTNDASGCKGDCPDGSEISAIYGLPCDLCKHNSYRNASIHDLCTPCPDDKVAKQNGATSPEECQYPACQPGNYLDVNSSTCVPCTDEEYQDEFWQTECKKCENSTKALSIGATNSTDCKPYCEPGYEMKDTCVPCKRGFYKTNDVDVFSMCISCADTFTTDGEASTSSDDCTIKICKKGQTTTKEKCFECNRDTYQELELPTSLTKCKPCTGQTGTKGFGSTDVNDCLPYCYAGKQYSSKSNRCEQCPRGTFNAGFDEDSYTGRFDDCELCKTGYSTHNLGSTSFDDCIPYCEPGYEMKDTCIPCTRGFYKTNDVDVFSKCISCADTFTTDDEASTSSDDCNIKICKKGQRTTKEKCVDCFVDTYQELDLPTSLTKCKPCSGQTGTKGFGSTDVNDCLPYCYAGKQYSSKSNRCEQCPRGTFNAGFDEDSYTGRFDDCELCKTGYSTQNLGSTSFDDCIPYCEPGYEMKDTCVPCTRGFYKTNDLDVFSKCIPCADTFTTDDEASSSSDDCNIKICKKGQRTTKEKCVDCFFDTYQELDLPTSLTKCKPCTGQTGTKDTGSTDVNDCLPYCYAGKQYSSKSNRCEQCPRGTFNAGFDEDSYTGRFDDCELCKTGYSTHNLGSTSFDDCIPYCEPGYEMKDTCVPCTRGFYKTNDLDVFSKCIPCADTFTTDDEASTSSDDCNITYCYAGKQYSSKSNRCEQCPRCTFNAGFDEDSYTGRFDDCELCKTGYSTQNLGSTSSDDCIPYCEPGYEMKDTCVPCTRGFYKTNDLDVFSKCIPCADTFTTDDEASTSSDDCNIKICKKGQRTTKEKCVDCFVDTYQELDLPTSLTKCKPCTGQTGTKGFGSTDVNDCLPYCYAGKQYSSKSNRCEQCPRGTFNAGFDEDSYTGRFDDCELCKTGYSTQNLGSTSSNDCIQICKKGQTTTKEKCAECNRDTYQELELPTSLTKCKPCSGQTGTRGFGSTDVNDCLPYCSPGEQYNSSSMRCEQCPRGTFNEGGKDDRFDDCKLCTIGYTTQNLGSTSSGDCNINVCTPCAKNTYQSQVGQTSCESCSQGKATEDIRSTAATDCFQICKPGEYLDKVARKCKKCPLGEYSTIGGLNTKCTKCETGKSTANTGSTSSSDCNLEACQIGRYRVAGACVPCPIGTYQDGSTHTCTDCKPTETTLITGGISQSVCVDICGPGVQYYVQYKKCKKCPIGHYKDDTMVSCDKCSEGQTTINTGSTSCITSHVREKPGAVRTTFTIISFFIVDSNLCNGNNGQLGDFLRTILQEAILAQARKYPDVCSKVGCTNVVTTVTTCTDVNPSRKKRGLDELPPPARVETTTVVRDVPFDVTSSKTTRETEKVLDEALYDSTLFDKRMREYNVSLGGFTLTKAPACEEGEERPADNVTCVDCPAGTFYDKVNFKCVECARGYYQPSTKQLWCFRCRGNDSTVSTGSKSESNCLPPCELNTGYCLNGGICKSNNGDLVCDCPVAYEGDQCDLRKGSSMELKPILGIAIGGSMVLLLLILLIVAGCIYFRMKMKIKNKSPERSVTPEREEKGIMTPYGSLYSSQQNSPFVTRLSTRQSNAMKPIAGITMPYMNMEQNSFPSDRSTNFTNRLR